MRFLQTSLLSLFVCLACCTSASAECPPWRPCGPGNPWGGNRLIGQGAYGADFRPACAAHDACYATGCNRRECDRQFLNNMCSACACSSNPRACQRKAHMYYVAARLCGGMYFNK